MKKLSDYQLLQLRIVEKDLQQAFLRLSDLFLTNVVGTEYKSSVELLWAACDELHESIKKQTKGK